MQGVVEVVGPLGVEPVAAGSRRAHEPGVVEVALGDEPQRAAEVGAPARRTSVGAAASRMWMADCVDDGVHGVEAQPVDVVVAQPHAGRCR